MVGFLISPNIIHSLHFLFIHHDSHIIYLEKSNLTPYSKPCAFANLFYKPITALKNHDFQFVLRPTRVHLSNLVVELKPIYRSLLKQIRAPPTTLTI